MQPGSPVRERMSGWVTVSPQCRAGQPPGDAEPVEEEGIHVGEF